LFGFRGLGLGDLFFGFILIQAFGQVCDDLFEILHFIRMLDLKHGEIPFFQSELTDILVGDPGNQALNHALHGFLESAGPVADLRLNIIRQRKLLGLLHVFRGEVVFPDLADPGKVAFAVKCLVDVGRGDLPAEL
jgi:hypothetical protein